MAEVYNMCHVYVTITSWSWANLSCVCKFAIKSKGLNTECAFNEIKLLFTHFLILILMNYSGAPNCNQYKHQWKKQCVWGGGGGGGGVFFFLLFFLLFLNWKDLSLSTVSAHTVLSSTLFLSTISVKNYIKKKSCSWRWLFWKFLA